MNELTELRREIKQWEYHASLAAGEMWQVQERCDQARRQPTDLPYCLVRIRAAATNARHHLAQVTYPAEELLQRTWGRRKQLKLLGENARQLTMMD